MKQEPFPFERQISCGSLNSDVHNVENSNFSYKHIRVLSSWVWIQCWWRWIKMLDIIAIKCCTQNSLKIAKCNLFCLFLTDAINSDRIWHLLSRICPLCNLINGGLDPEPRYKISNKNREGFVTEMKRFEENIRKETKIRAKTYLMNAIRFSPL